MSTYAPVHTSQFNALSLKFNGQGAIGTVPAGTTADIDLLVTADHLLTGGVVISSGAAFGDKATLQVVDVGGTYASAGTVLNQFVTNWYVSEAPLVLEVDYPAKILAGLTLRLKFTSTGGAEVKAAANYMLHKVTF